MNTAALATIIADRLTADLPALKRQWQTARPFRYFILDDLLPPDIAQHLHRQLPDAGELMVRQSDKERKRVGISLERYAPEIGAILLAFQDERIVRIFSELSGIESLTPDPSLYGSGISEMLQGDFLLPHLDNSHDGDGRLYRVLNALYYITPDWPADKGGNLELWSNRMTERVEVHAKFNRLVLMETHTGTIHSVSKVAQEGGRRSCISNYYFSPEPVQQKPYVHRTTFFARPEDSTAKKIKLRAEGALKNFLGQVLKNSAAGTRHRRPQD